MEYTTYLKENNFLVLTNDTDYLVFRWTGKECIVAKCDMTLMYKIDLSGAKIVFAWTTKSPDMGEVQKALYKITGKAFDLSFDEDYDPIFTEWNLRNTISVSYYYDALYEEFNK